MNWFTPLAPAEHAAALAALETAAVACPVSPAGLLHFSGEETQAFLHGQLSSDIKALDDSSAQYACYSTPKGRMLASFLVFRQGGDYWLQLADELTPALQKRLSMYIMRSKTRCTDASAERALIGVAGPQAAARALALAGIEQLAELSIHHGADFSLIALPGARFQFVTTPDAAPALWQKLLDAGCVPGGQPLWQLSDIRAGIPWISAATQEEFVLQMANLDLIGAVSFTKGCYPGQEIVARTRYLGKVKRRMYRVSAARDVIAAGQDIFSPEMNGQPSGKILQASPTQTGHWEALVVAQMSSLEHGLHLDNPAGPELTILPLPYAVE
ncbi:MAG: folate-binding protein [Proteobacteria bacterium]|nr:folate-binding protein [Pseudomonadota bacterium]